MKTTRPIKEQWSGTGTPPVPAPNPESHLPKAASPAIVVARRAKKDAPPADAPAPDQPPQS